MCSSDLFLEPLAGVALGECREEGEGLFGEVTIGHFVGSSLNVCVGWVERSDTQQLQTMGIALLNPSYAC